MELYKKLFRFLKPHLKNIALSMLLTLCYVMLNNVSLWVSVDFIGELFPKSTAEQTQTDVKRSAKTDFVQVEQAAQTDTDKVISDSPRSKIKKTATKVKTNALPHSAQPNFKCSPFASAKLHTMHLGCARLRVVAMVFFIVAILTTISLRTLLKPP